MRVRILEMGIIGGRGNLQAAYIKQKEYTELIDDDWFWRKKTTSSELSRRERYGCRRK